MKHPCKSSLNTNKDENKTTYANQAQSQLHVGSIRPLKNKYLRMKTIWFYVIIMGFIFGCSDNSSEIGTKKRPVRLYLVPSVGIVSSEENIEEITAFLLKETGYHFEVTIPSNYISVVEALGDTSADVAILNTIGYWLANKKYQVHARLKIHRYGSDSYQGAIITHVDSRIDSLELEKLTGKRFAFVDATSSSGYHFPSILLKKNHVELGNTVFAMTHDNVVEMVYHKQVDAGSCYYSPSNEKGEISDTRSRLLQQYPDVIQKTKIIALTDTIPNDIVVTRNGLTQQVEEKIVTAIINLNQSEKGHHFFKKLYNIDSFSRVDDSEYEIEKNTKFLFDSELEQFLK